MNALGLTFGPTIKGNVNNPKGYFENRHVRERVLKKYISRAGGEPEGQRNFPTPGRGNPQDLRRDTLSQLKGATAYKDAKILLLWQLWAEAFPDCLYVFVRRDVDDIARSCLNTGFMSTYKSLEGWKKWALHYVGNIEKMKRQVEHIEVWPDGTAEVFEPVAEFAGLEWNEKAVRDFVDPTLWNRHTR